MAFNMNDYLARTMRRESGGRDNAKNPLSTASGRFQFLDSTYLPYAQRLNPQVSEGALMAQKNDPKMQSAVMQAFTQDNVNALQNAGIAPTNGSAYLAHFLGAGGATKALKADPNAPIGSVVDQAAIRANPGVFNNIKTVADLQRWADGDGGSPMQQAMARNSSADMMDVADAPAEGANPVSFTPPPGAEPSFMSGGPGALFGAPQEGWNAGDAMYGAGLAMMARDNPTGAAALASALRYSKDKTAKKGKSVTIDKDSGKSFVTDLDTGQTTTQQVTDPKPPKMAEGTQARYQKNYDAMETAFQTKEKLNEFRGLIADGQIDLSLAGRIGKNFKEVMDDSDPVTRNTARFMATMEDMRNARLLEAKGVQTEGDAQRAMNALIPGTSTYDNKTVLSLLDKGAADLDKAWRKHAKYNELVLGRYKDHDPDFGGLVAERAAKSDTFERDYAPRRDAYLSKSPTPPATTQAAPTGRAPAQSGGGGDGKTVAQKIKEKYGIK